LDAGEFSRLPHLDCIERPIAGGHRVWPPAIEERAC
jgi:hypothetical protein